MVRERWREDDWEKATVSERMSGRGIDTSPQLASNLIMCASHVGEERRKRKRKKKEERHSHHHKLRCDCSPAFLNLESSRNILFIWFMQVTKDDFRASISVKGYHFEMNEDLRMKRAGMNQDHEMNAIMICWKGKMRKREEEEKRKGRRRRERKAKQWKESSQRQQQTRIPQNRHQTYTGPSFSFC